MAAMERHIAKLQGIGCEVVAGGLVDRPERSLEAGDLFARERVDLGHQLGKIAKLAKLLDLELVVVCR